jgi:hypothetical protein
VGREPGSGAGERAAGQACRGGPVPAERDASRGCVEPASMRGDESVCRHQQAGHAGTWRQTAARARTRSGGGSVVHEPWTPRTSPPPVEKAQDEQDEGSVRAPEACRTPPSRARATSAPQPTSSHTPRACITPAEPERRAPTRTVKAVAGWRRAMRGWRRGPEAGPATTPSTHPSSRRRAGTDHVMPQPRPSWSVSPRTRPRPRSPARDPDPEADPGQHDAHEQQAPGMPRCGPRSRRAERGGQDAQNQAAAADHEHQDAADVERRARSRASRTATRHTRTRSTPSETRSRHTIGIRQGDRHRHRHQHQHEGDDHRGWDEALLLDDAHGDGPHPHPTRAPATRMAARTSTTSTPITRSPHSTDAAQHEPRRHPPGPPTFQSSLPIQCASPSPGMSTPAPTRTTDVAPNAAAVPPAHSEPPHPSGAGRDSRSSPRSPQPMAQHAHGPHQLMAHHSGIPTHPPRPATC